MKKLPYFLPLVFAFLLHSADGQSIQVSYDTSSPQASYAAGVIKKSLKEKGYSLGTGNAAYRILLSLDSNRYGNESYETSNDGKTIHITGGDDRGLVYGSLGLAENIANGVNPAAVKPIMETPHYSLRAVKFDLPWDTYRHSYALDLHEQTCKDLEYWEAFLDLMAENRLNALTLWNLHPYTFMIRPKNFPEACPFNDKELADWQALFHGIFNMAHERAIDVFIIPFNIFVSPEFSVAHNVNMDNLDHHFFIKGDTSELVKRYTRECVTQMLQEYPNITGMGLTLGEGMAGMTPKEREDWMSETIIEGMRLAGRKLKLVHRIPFSSTTGSLGVTSIETEVMTRQVIDEQGTFSFIDKPIYADLKYNWSHAHSTPTLVKVHGGKLYDTYFKPEPENYKISWTARNEDFFCLRWGVPGFVRAHIAENSQSYVGGYFIGSETYIPAKDYFTNPGIKVNWKYAFERQWLFYKIWGRLLYNPETPDTVFQDEFTRRYGKKGATLLEASSLAGNTPLRLASLYDFTFDLTLYSEGFMALDRKVQRLEYISADNLIVQPVLDPTYVNVEDYVRAVNKDSVYSANMVTPIKLAAMLAADCSKAIQLVDKIDVRGNTALMFEVADIKAWSYMGLHFAEKLEGAVALQTYRTKGGEQNKQNAIKHFQRALAYWDTLVSITRPIYNDMPLVHLSEQNGVRSKENQTLTFHWEKLRPDVAKDVEVARAAKFIR